MIENSTSWMKDIIIIVLSYVEPNSDKDTMLRFCYIGKIWCLNV